MNTCDILVVHAINVKRIIGVPVFLQFFLPWLWQVPQPMRGEPDRIKLWTQVISGFEVDELTAIRVLDAAAWEQRRRRLQELGGPPVE